MDRKRQLEEVDSLKSIFYSEEFQVPYDLSENAKLRAVFWAFLELPDNYIVKYLDSVDSPEPSLLKIKYLPPIELQLTLPENYPSIKPPKFVIGCQWLNKNSISKLCKKLDEIWGENEGGEIIYSWCYFLKNDTLSFLGCENELDITHLCSKHLLFLENEKRIKKNKKVWMEKKAARYERKKAEGPEESGVDQAGEPGTSEVARVKEELPKHSRTHYWRRYPRKKSNYRQNTNRYKFDERAVLNLSLKMSPMKILENYNAERAKVEFLRSFFLCNICFSDKQGKNCIQFKDCNHVFCLDCIRSYFTVKIQDGFTQSIKCPEEKCSTEALPSQIKETVSEELFAKYDSLLLSNALNTLGDIIFCPRQICQYPVSWDPEEKMACCPNCQYVFCVTCKMVYHGVEPCQYKAAEVKKLVEEYENGSSELKKQLESKYGKKILDSLVNNTKAETWIKDNSKPCPKCDVAIEKSQGCNKMVCWNCNTSFCWLCSEILDPKKPYAHYADPKSRCAEKLFHLVYNFDTDEEENDWDWLEEDSEEDFSGSDFPSDDDYDLFEEDLILL